MTTSLIGFLYFNWWPSKMFMGDSGSQFIGAVLASMGIIFFWNIEPVSNDRYGFSMQIILPVLAFIVPIADTTTVVINRLSRGQSPFIGGKDHTTHNLVRLGMKDMQVALTIALICVISSVMIIFYYVNPRQLELWEKIVLVSYLIVVFAGLFTATRLKKNKEMPDKQL